MFVPNEVLRMEAEAATKTGERCSSNAHVDLHAGGTVASPSPNPVCLVFDPRD